MAAPVSFREKLRFFSLAPRASSIHDPIRSLAGLKSRSAAVLCYPFIRRREVRVSETARVHHAGWRFSRVAGRGAMAR
jgi:hypothetical protein